MEKLVPSRHPHGKLARFKGTMVRLLLPGAMLFAFTLAWLVRDGWGSALTAFGREVSLEIAEMVFEYRNLKVQVKGFKVMIRDTVRR